MDWEVKLTPPPGFFLLALHSGSPEEEGHCPLITVLHILFNVHFNTVKYIVLSYHKIKQQPATALTTTSHSKQQQPATATSNNKNASIGIS